MDTLTTSLIIPVHANQNRFIFEVSFNSIIKALPRPTEIIIVSDGDMIDLPKLDPEDACRIRRVATGVRSGPAVARNLGARYATGDILCFIDSDIVIPTHLFDQIVEEFNDSQNMDALFGSYDKDPYMPNFLSQYRNLLHHYVHQNGQEEAFTFWSGCGAIRRKVFLDVGGFDGERYPDPSIEDIELGYRLRKSGHSISLCKHIQVKHLKKWEAHSMMKVDFWYRALPWTKLLLQEKEFKNDLNLKVKDRLSVAAIFSLLLSLFIGVWLPQTALLSIPLFFYFVYLNIGLYNFFYRHKGLWFSLRVVPWHSVFYFISGLAFFVGFANSYKGFHVKSISTVKS